MKNRNDNLKVEKYVSANDYAKLLNEKVVDKIGNKLSIGDKVGYALTSRYVSPVYIGEIEDIILYYSSIYNYSADRYDIDFNLDNMIIELQLIPADKRERKVKRRSSYVVKVV